MVRPKMGHPTPGELEVLQVLWDRGPSTVREVMEALNQRRERAYTTVMSLLNVMTDKGLLVRQPDGRAFLYSARVPRKKALGRLLDDLLGRAFEGSAAAMVAHLLDQTEPSEAELQKIREAIDQYLEQQEDAEKGDRHHNQ
jgi:BlaI family transcriptional regulator, penicillinase repressor